MSWKLAEAVMDRYNGTNHGELCLAIALASFGNEDGTNIYPSVPRLASMSRQSERTTQIYMRRLQASRWLEPVGDSRGGRGRTRQYRINPAWIKGEALAAPFDLTKGEGIAARFAPSKGCSTAPERVQPGALKGEAAAAPDSPLLIKDSPVVPRRKATRALSLPEYIDECRTKGVDPIPPDDAVFVTAERLGIPDEFLTLAWAEFRRHRLPGGRYAMKRQVDWRATFRNAVDGRWGELWWFPPSGGVELTSNGRQAQIHHRAESTTRPGRIAA